MTYDGMHVVVKNGESLGGTKLLFGSQSLLPATRLRRKTDPNTCMNDSVLFLPT